MKSIRCIGIALCIMVALASQCAFASSKSTKNSASTGLKNVIKLRMDISVSGSGSKVYTYSYSTSSTGAEDEPVILEVHQGSRNDDSTSAVNIILAVTGSLVPKIVTEKNGHKTISVSGDGYISCALTSSASSSFSRSFSNPVYSLSRKFKVAVALKPGEKKEITSDYVSMAGESASNNSLLITLTATIDDGLVKLPNKNKAGNVEQSKSQYNKSNLPKTKQSW